MPNGSGCSGLPDEPGSSGFVVEIARVNHFERHGTLQVNVDSLVGYPHRAAAELKWLAIVALQNLIMSESEVVDAGLEFDRI